MKIRLDISTIKADIALIKRDVKKYFIMDHASLMSQSHRGQPQNTPATKSNTAEMFPSKGNLLDKFKFPLSEQDEIERLEETLRLDPEFRQQMVTMAVKISGTRGDEDGHKVAYKLADALFRSSLLMQFSWTGVSRGKLLEKKPFQNYIHILNVFFEVVTKADNRFTIQKTKNVFKDGLLKHARKRNERKRQGLYERIEGESCAVEDSTVNNEEELFFENTEEGDVDMPHQ
ncbi:uncharacterized protein [Euwallacea fornicatus]|uniref:uncharacterized protein isoform X2 n=1 Tax=Euwallacea fornicatus TaxID=995702 RepID=UPI00338E07FF